mmetsp:Transcript_10764/g.30660  ORF Transcript_10764/g.30660 Transcript_10764/m.30660 type:complete len:261 (-) Transcript_10764:1294-2076(-)
MIEVFATFRAGVRETTAGGNAQLHQPFCAWASAQRSGCHENSVVRAMSCEVAQPCSVVCRLNAGGISIAIIVDRSISVGHEIAKGLEAAMTGLLHVIGLAGNLLQNFMDFVRKGLPSGNLTMGARSQVVLGLRRFPNWVAGLSFVHCGVRPVLCKESLMVLLLQHVKQGRFAIRVPVARPPNACNLEGALKANWHRCVKGFALKSEAPATRDPRTSDACFLDGHGLLANVFTTTTRTFEGSEHPLQECDVTEHFFLLIFK